jgi:branched-chain amino acid transport system substrate-binding protein
MTASDSEAVPMDRRRFVRLAGAAAGLAAIGQLSSPDKARAAAGTALRVGVMVPTGSSYRRMGGSLLDGLRLGFDDARGGTVVNASIVSREVEGGHVGALSTARELLDGGCDVVVAGVSAIVARRLGDLFLERRTPLVVANVGAHVVPPAARNDYVLHNSLLYWQANHALGRWAARRLGARAFIAAAASDAGYDTVYALRRGFEAAGGTVVGDRVTHDGGADAGFSDLLADIRKSGANVVFGLYSGPSAAAFVRAYRGSGLSAWLAVGGLGVEDVLLPSIGRSAVGVLSCASWSATRRTRANRSFGTAFESRYGRAADPFAVLGYDTAAFVIEGVRRATKARVGVRRLVRAVGGVTLETPRGALTVDARTNTIVGPLAIRRVRKNGLALANYELAVASAVGSLPVALASLASGDASGYINEYLCT